MPPCRVQLFAPKKLRVPGKQDLPRAGRGKQKAGKHTPSRDGVHGVGGKKLPARPSPHHCICQVSRRSKPRTTAESAKTVRCKLARHFPIGNKRVDSRKVAAGHHERGEGDYLLRLHPRGDLGGGRGGGYTKSGKVDGN